MDPVPRRAFMVMEKRERRINDQNIHVDEGKDRCR